TNHPDIAITVTTASRSAVDTHWMSATEASNSSTRVSIPTATIVASNDAMKVPSTRMNATPSNGAPVRSRVPPPRTPLLITAHQLFTTVCLVGSTHRAGRTSG